MSKSLSPTEVTSNYWFGQHKYSANKRGFTPLSREIWERMAKRPCAYCGEMDIQSIMNCKAYKDNKTIDIGYAIAINGIDRVDSTEDYSEQNSVSCCCVCNRIKGVLDSIDFERQVRKIRAYRCDRYPGKENPDASPSKKAATPINLKYAQYAHKAKMRDKVPLSKQDWLKLVFRACYYCNEFGSKSYKVKSYEVKVAINGIDRVDSDLGYEISNVIPCCPKCNRMKLDLKQEDFLIQIQKIDRYLNPDHGILQSEPVDTKPAPPAP